MFSWWWLTTWEGGNHPRNKTVAPVEIPFFWSAPTKNPPQSFDRAWRPWRKYVKNLEPNRRSFRSRMVDVVVFCCWVVMLVSDEDPHQAFRRWSLLGPSALLPLSSQTLQHHWKGAFEGVSWKQPLGGARQLVVHAHRCRISWRETLYPKSWRTENSDSHVFESLCLIYAAFFDMEPFKY